MKEISDVTAVVCDHGIFLPTALRLGRSFKKVYYWTPVEKAFPCVRDCVGDGFEEIERVQSPWQVKEEADLFVFPDVGFADMQAELIGQGIPVWGANGGDILELSRGKFLKELKASGLTVPEHEAFEGITALRDYLRDKEDLWIKTSRYRGDWETMHWRSWEEDETALDEKAAAYGPFRERIIFYVFQPIETDNEDGCDTWAVDGQYPELVIHGMESKDRAYLGTFQEYASLPEELRRVNDAFGPVLARYHYRSFFSTEVRITESGESFFIDPTCRSGSPPSQVMTEMIGNFAAVVWGGANGELVEPEPAAKFGVQAVLEVKGDEAKWLNFKLPYDLEQWVKPSNAVKEGDQLWLAPDPHGHFLSWLVGVGDRPDEAIRHLQHNASLLPEGTHCEFDAMADLIEKITKAQEQGIEFGEKPMPEPAIVLEEK